jgi:Fe-S-cluster containining protein
VKTGESPDEFVSIIIYSDTSDKSIETFWFNVASMEGVEDPRKYDPKRIQKAKHRIKEVSSDQSPILALKGKKMRDDLYTASDLFELVTNGLRFDMCCFLDAEKLECTIYTFLPLKCKLYPYEYRIGNKGRLKISTSENCPGLTWKNPLDRVTYQKLIYLANRDHSEFKDPTFTRFKELCLSAPRDQLYQTVIEELIQPKIEKCEITWAKSY